MERTVFEQMGGTYHKEGEYLFPDLAVNAFLYVGIWGERRRQYLREHQKGIYTGLLLSGKLNNHLAEINQQAEDMYARLIERMAQRQGVNEALKATDPMAWVGRMNSIRVSATEVVNAELIYT